MKTSTTTVQRPLATAEVGLARGAAAMLAGGGPPALPRAAGDDQWVRALRIRSQALNRLQHPDRATAADSTRAAAPPWMRALRIRSEALNRIYSSSLGLPREGSGW